MIKFVLFVYEYFSKRKILLFGTLTLLVVFLALTASRINFIEDISAFLPKDTNSERINNATQHINAANKLMVSVNMSDSTVSPNPDLIIEAIDFFVEQLQQTDSENLYFKKIDYKIEQEQILALSQFYNQFF